MRAIAIASAISMGWAVTCDGQQVSPPPPPAAARPSTGAARPSPVDFSKDIEDQRILIAKLEKEGVQAVDLNRARMRIAIALLNQAIVTLRAPGSDVNRFDKATEYITDADSYNVSIDAGVLNEEDRRVYADLQALSRRALGEQVVYLRGLLPAAATPQTPPDTTVAPPDQPVLIYPVYPGPPGCQAIPVMPRRCGLFRRFQAR
jgi:hypothetical protein